MNVASTSDGKECRRFLGSCSRFEWFKAFSLINSGIGQYIDAAVEVNDLGVDAFTRCDLFLKPDDYSGLAVKIGDSEFNALPATCKVAADLLRRFKTFHYYPSVMKG